MPSAYLQSGDYSTYGVSSATAPQVLQASALIDGFLRRPHGVEWKADAAGNPAYMAAMTASYTLTSTGSISPGSDVSVPVTGPMSQVEAGTVLILDAATPAAVEACVVKSTTATTVVLASVTYSHAVSTKLDGGLTIREQLMMPKGRPITHLSNTPAVRVLSGIGRYGYGRRGSQNNYQMNDSNLLAMMTHFGGPPSWESFEPTQGGLDITTGEFWAPAGIMLAYYSEIRVEYVAGWLYANIPWQIKQACANIITTVGVYADLSGNIKSLKAGDTNVERFADTVLDADTRAMLQPFVARAWS